MRPSGLSFMGCPRTGARRRGFSILEAVAALVVVAILAVVVAARVGPLESSVVAEAQILRGHLRFIQAMAMCNNTVAWSVHIASSSYTMQRNGVPAPMNLPDEDAPTHRLEGGVSLSGDGGVVSIDEWGVPDRTRTFIVGDGVHQQSVTFLGGTGLIR